MGELNTNNITLLGKLVGDFELDHESVGEKFYKNYISTMRDSGTEDVLPVIVSEKLLESTSGVSGQKVYITGRISTKNITADGKKKLLIFAFATYIEIGNRIEELQDVNVVSMTGTICKPPTYRETPFGRQISDIIIAVNRKYGRTDYVHIICWGRNALWASSFAVGEKITVCGRFQSRKYVKKMDDLTEDKIAYEVSVSKLEIGEEGE